MFCVMRPTEQTYNQPEKEATRQRVIAHAVHCLTAARCSSPVVTSGEFEQTMDYCLRFLERRCGMKLREAVKPFAEDWYSLHKSRVGTKKAEDINVLFLAGSDPTADLMAFKKGGVPFANIWAIEGDSPSFKQAVAVLGREGMQLKLHNGSLQNFFSIVPQQFDLVYLDACGPLFGGRPNTIHVVRELFLNQRLAPLSVLITNFSEPCPNLDPKIISRRLAAAIVRKFSAVLPPTATSAGTGSPAQPSNKGDGLSQEEQNFVKWGRLVGLWSYAHGDNDIWTQDFDEFVETEVLPDLLRQYSQFTTEFIVRFAGQLLAWWRIAALPGARREYFNEENLLLNAVEEGMNTIEALSHPLYGNLRHVLFTSWNLGDSGALSEFYFKETLEKVKLGDAVKVVSLIRNFFESTVGDTLFRTDHIRRACNPNLVNALKTFEWFARDARIFCDIPMPNLIADLLIGLYGYPYHANTKKMQRIAYKAKETVMFTDVFVFDQARYLYDSLPTLPFFDESFPLPQQLVLRVCMDAIHRHSHFGCPDLFQGCALAAAGEDGFTFWSPPTRESIGCPPVEGDESAPVNGGCPPC